MAYAYSHQRVRRPISKPENPENPTFTDQTDPFWGWSWLERWMATRPWENNTTQDRHVIINHDNPTPKPKPPLSTPPSKPRSLGPKTRPTGSKSGPSSLKSEDHRRHTIAGLSVKDDEKKAIPKTILNEVAKAKTKTSVASRLGNVKTDKGSFGSTKKQLSYSTSSLGVRRHSGPPKVDGTS